MLLNYEDEVLRWTIGYGVFPMPHETLKVTAALEQLSILEYSPYTLRVLCGILVPSVALPRSAAGFPMPRHLMVK
jgi:hypothetical protein